MLVIGALISEAVRAVAKPFVGLSISADVSKGLGGSFLSFWAPLLLKDDRSDPFFFFLFLWTFRVPAWLQSEQSESTSSSEWICMSFCKGRTM